MLTVLLAVILMFATVPAWALFYLGSIDTLPNSNPNTEEKWLEGLLGLTNDSASVNYITKIDFSNSPPSLNQFDPESSWAYVVVKYARTWEAYRSDGERYLTVGDLPPQNRSSRYVRMRV